MQYKAAVKVIGHDEQLTFVDHRRGAHAADRDRRGDRVAFGLCFSQNHRLLRLMNLPLAHQSQKRTREGHGPWAPPTRCRGARAT
jgi:hypothetical protein